jgi:lipid-binding SYLF domain-containing protein
MTFLCTALAGLAITSGCSTTPKEKDQGKIIADSQTTIEWFTDMVPGLEMQLENSAGFIVYPGIGQYGIIITGGRFGQGVVYTNTEQQIGWAYLNTASAGLQIGAQGFKLVVFENEETMQQFEENKLTGNAGATIVAANSGAAGTASFTNGVAVYQGGQTGAMAGASIGLDYMRFEALKD